MTSSTIEDQLTLLPAGKYILAVSGGVDSVALLDLLSKNSNLELIVAHFDHGIRENSNEDLVFTKNLAEKYNLPFVSAAGNLGSEASEDIARKARYDFLMSQAENNNALGIITAHHQDDVIETFFINLIRGTGRHGLAALKNRPGVFRPLLNVSKEHILTYAEQNKLAWREDETNNDVKYLRNLVRKAIALKLKLNDRQRVLEVIRNTEQINNKIDGQINFLLNKLLHKGKPILSRKKFCGLDDKLSQEIIYAILNNFKFGEIDKKTIDKLTVQIKTLQTGKVIQFSGGSVFLTKRSARFKNHAKQV